MTDSELWGSFIMGLILTTVITALLSMNIKGSMEDDIYCAALYEQATTIQDSLNIAKQFKDCAEPDRFFGQSGRP